jgi:hypothetical protein
LAAVAVSSAAFAQATITGTFGVAMQSYENPAQAVGAVCTGTTAAQCQSVAPQAVKKATNNGAAMTDASVRVAVSEDLGGGVRASGFVQFAQPHGTGVSRGTAVTKEDSSLALSGGFGTVSISNTRSGNVAIGANVFGTSLPYTTFYGSSSNAGVATRGNGDLISYSSPAISGFTLGVAQFEASEGVLTSANKVSILSANYAEGPLTVAFASKSKNAAMRTATNMKTENELAVTYNLGVARVGLGYGSKVATTGKALTSYGVSVPMGAITVGLNGAQRGDATFTEGGLKYAFSKRTTLNAMYGTYEMLEVKAGTATATAVGAGKIDAIKGNQYRVGIVHTF